MHKNCKNAGDGQSMTAYAMFDGGNVQVKDMPKVMETMQNVKTKRLERAKAITKMQNSKHIEIKFFEFFIIAMTRGF